MRPQVILDLETCEHTQHLILICSCPGVQIVVDENFEQNERWAGNSFWFELPLLCLFSIRREYDFLALSIKAFWVFCRPILGIDM